MFFGMSFCFIPHKIMIYLNKNNLNGLNDQVNDFNPFVFFPAAIFDLVSTCIQYFALNLTYASSFQMLMGILFVSSIL